MKIELQGNTVNTKEQKIWDDENTKGVRFLTVDPIPSNVNENGLREWVNNNVDNLAEETKLDLEGFILTHINIFRSLNHAGLSHHITITFNKIPDIGGQKVISKNGNTIVTQEKISWDDLIAWLPSSVVHGYGVYGFYQHQQDDGNWQTRWTTGSTCD